MEEFFDVVRRYNFWDGKEVPTGFPRRAYTEKVAQYLGNRVIKVLTGQRRAGKSYILRQLAARLIAQGTKPANILFIDKEFEDFDFLQTHRDLNALIKTYEQTLRPEGKVYLFIDEVQDIEEWEKTVNSYSQDYTREYEIFLTGSNSKMLSGELSTRLSGRYVEFEVFPLSFEEFCTARGAEAGRRSYLDYMQTGGLPELGNLHGEETKRHYVSSLKNTILFKDIIQRYRIKDSRLLEDIFAFLVNNVSNLVSITGIVNYFKSRGNATTYDTVAGYIDCMTEAFLLHKAERYNIRGKEILSGNCKFYSNDQAFRNYLYRGFAHGMGYQLENMVYLELLRNGYEVYVGNIKGREVDFAALKNGEILYVQSAYLLFDEDTIKREYSPLESINDHFRKLVVSLDELQLPSKTGIEHVRAWELGGRLRQM